MSHFDPDTVEIQLVTDTQTAGDFLRWLSDFHEPLMGLDVETDGLDWFDGTLRLVQFGGLNSGWAIPFGDFKNLCREALTIITAKGLHIVGHNFKFDLHWLERNTGWVPSDWALVHDTMLIAGVVDSSGSKALKDLSVHYVHPVAKEGQKRLKDDFKKGGWSWGTVPVDLPSYWVYGVLDTILTVNLFNVMIEKAQAAGCMDAYSTERGALPVLYHMERKGMLVDGEYCKHEMAALQDRCGEIEHNVSEYGVDNIRSNAQIARALLDHGVELTNMTGAGNWVMNSETLDGIVASTGHPLATAVQEYRRSLKMANSYYYNFLAFQRSDGRVHPSYRQIQAKTGRMSCTGPAMQTLPRPGTDPKVRNSFVADQGNVMVSCDFSNIEARLFAHFAQEMGMINAIRSGMDLHSYTAKAIFDLDYYPGKDDPQRQIAKNCLFCTLFGGGASKVAMTGGVPLAEAERALTGLFAAFPGIKQFQRVCQQAGIDNLNQYNMAFIRGVDGRILSMVETDDRYYAFTNWLIQSTAAIVLKRRMAVIDNMGLTEFCVAAIHDEIVAEVPEDFEEEYRMLIQEAMNDEDSYSVPITAEPGKGAVRLGDAK